MIEILEKKNCCGCSACASVCPKNCIAMKEDSEGFVYPHVDEEKCVQCGLCEKVCPILNNKEEVPFEQEGYIVQNKNSEVLRESTAGGAFTAIAKYVINRGGVVFGVELSKDFQVHHICVEKVEDLYKYRNSKYVQSYVDKDIFRSVKQYLEQGKYVCFSGTPCQVEGLNSFLRKDYPNLILVDVVCRAVPSPLIFRKYLEYQRKHIEEKIENVRFRDKHFGYKYSTMNVITANNKGNYHKGVESDLWLRAFFSNICDRPSCHDCQFRKRYRVSDFTIWDCFHVGRFSKELDNDKGATRMLVHSQKGKNILEEVLADFNYLKIEPEKIIKDSVELKGSVAPHERRTEFFEDAAKLDAEQLFNKYFPENFKVKVEHAARMICYKLGIYSVVKKIWVKIIKKY